MHIKGRSILYLRTGKEDDGSGVPGLYVRVQLRRRQHHQHRPRQDHQDLDGDLSGKDVLIVEDILDTGITLSNLVPMLKMRNPNSVKICTILDKPSRRKADIAPDYEALQCRTSSWWATASTTTRSTATCPTSAYSNPASTKSKK